MTKKQLALLATAVVIAGTFLYYQTDWFRRTRIQIYHRALPKMDFAARKRPGAPAPAPLLFGFDHKLKLTSVEVFPVSDLETNQRPHPLWHLITSSNSLPTEGFIYGGRVPGMQLAVNDAYAEPLEPGVKYRLLIEAGSIKAQHDFTPIAAKP